MQLVFEKLDNVAVVLFLYHILLISWWTVSIPNSLKNIYWFFVFIFIVYSRDLDLAKKNKQRHDKKNVNMKSTTEQETRVNKSNADT